MVIANLEAITVYTYLGLFFSRCITLHLSTLDFIHHFITQPLISWDSSLTLFSWLWILIPRKMLRYQETCHLIVCLLFQTNGYNEQHRSQHSTPLYFTGNSPPQLLLQFPFTRLLHNYNSSFWSLNSCRSSGRIFALRKRLYLKSWLSPLQWLLERIPQTQVFSTALV